MSHSTVLVENNWAKRHVWLTYVALVVMNLLDLRYTDVAFSVSIEEANPVMKYMYQNFGMAGIVAIKFYFLGLLGIVLNSLPNYEYCFKFFYVAVGVYAALTGYHLYQYSTLIS